VLASQILQQIQQTAIQSHRSINTARQQTAAKERERRILQLTIKELDQVDKDVNLYKGVGKMCVSAAVFLAEGCSPTSASSTGS
jgi:chaperonin cofactor prefoldin